jgi:3-carboxy-cis,cis-muconate cycloisomerase
MTASLPFLPLVEKFGDSATNRIFGARRYLDACVTVELALARAEVALGLIPAEAVETIAAVTATWQVDTDEIWRDARHIGYPILPLLEQLEAALPESARGYLHWGATTQDIMDTALVLQLRDSTDRAERLLDRLGDAVAGLATKHAATVMPGRTHGQHAVPITLGLKCSVWLSEIMRHLARLAELRPRLLRGQLGGAGGTLAALGPLAAGVREHFCQLLDLGQPDTPWHTARDSLAEYVMWMAIVASTCGKVAREIADLARDEIGEVSERHEPLRGASSTMPQKRNPITAEVVIGFSVLVGANTPAALITMQPRHERAAGEWQAEWDTIPLVSCGTAGALQQLGSLLETLTVYPSRMRANLDRQGGLIMAESVMMALAPHYGRQEAHRLVYDAAQRVIDHDVSLEQALSAVVGNGDGAPLRFEELLDPETYLGECVAITEATVARWHQHRSETSTHARSLR